ncbi:MAG TPA: hypothetical protein VHB79_23565 [Polyangiaceae bacterium]|nr:hypothetical protein [Polyangiaceae bacterium]
MASAWSCGGSGRANPPGSAAAGGSSAGHAASPIAAAGNASPTGGNPAIAASGATSSSGGAASSLAGTPTIAAESGAGGDAPGIEALVGAGGADDGRAGFPCRGSWCEPGQACLTCCLADGAGCSSRCVPHPALDPAGYDDESALCQAPLRFDECDGPEDCAAGQFCVAREGAKDGFRRCRDAPSTVHSCCFACDALTDCTLCHDSHDCPVGESCQPNLVDDGMGCR